MKFEEGSYSGANPGGAYATPKRRFMPVSDLRRTVETLLRFKWAIFCSILVALMIGTGVIVFAKPQYTATLGLMLENSDKAIFETRDQASEHLRNEAEVFNEVVVVQSRGLANRVIDRLRLDEDPEFNAALRPQGPIAALISEYMRRDIDKYARS